MEEIDPVEVPPVAPPSLPRTIEEFQALFRLGMRKAAQRGYAPPAFDDEKFFREHPDLWRGLKPILRKALDGLCQRDMPRAWWKEGAAVDVYEFLERGREYERRLDRIARSAKRAAYDKSRVDRPTGRNVVDRSQQGGHFVAVDFEGIDFGKPFKRPGDDPKQNARYQQHRAIQVSAGGAAGYKDVHRQNVNGFTGEEICEILTSLPAEFVDPRKGSEARAAIFVSYAFGYDIGQIVRDMPYEDAWELLHGIPWDRRNDPKCEANFNRWVWWRHYALSYMPRKSITVARLKNPEKPGRHIKRTGNDWVSTETEIIPSSRIEIFDVFSYWGTRFVEALKDMPRIRLSDEDVVKIDVGKNKRGVHHRDRITEGDLAEMLEYNSLELIGLVDIVTSLRQGHRDAIAHAFPGRPILDPKRWWGRARQLKSSST
jgi:hypothetical protein